MSETKTGVEYPVLNLGGADYEVRFTRGLLYRLTKDKIAFVPQTTGNGASLSFDVIVDTLKRAISFPGTEEQLAELCYDRRDEILDILMAAWGKVVLPSLQTRAAARAANRQAVADLPN